MRDELVRFDVTWKVINQYNGAAVNRWDKKSSSQKKGIFYLLPPLLFAPRPKIGAMAIPELLILGALPLVFLQEHLFMNSFSFQCGVGRMLHVWPGSLLDIFKD